MKILPGVEPYRIKEPLFEGVRVIMTYLGEPYSAEYIQGISGAAFRIATGCPSRPTCCMMMGPADLIRLLGHECREIPCFGPAGEDRTAEMIAGIREEIDAGRPVLVWHALTSLEWDVVCGYDEEKGLFYGRGSYWCTDRDGYHAEPWDRAAKAAETCVALGALAVGDRTGDFDAESAELRALRDAASHAGTVKTEPEAGGWYSYEGLQAFRKWAEAYASPGKDRDLADAYCFDIYHSTHAAAPVFLREIAGHFPGFPEKMFLKAAEHMEAEAAVFAECAPFLGWGSPWGVDEARSRAVAPLLAQAAEHYADAAACLAAGLGDETIVNRK